MSHKIYDRKLKVACSVTVLSGAEADDQDLRPVWQSERTTQDFQARHHQQADKQGKQH